MEKESYDSKIRKLEKALNDARHDRAQAQARYEVLLKDLDELNHRIAEMGIKPEELDKRIIEIRDEIEGLIAKIETLIPRQYLTKVGW